MKFDNEQLLKYIGACTSPYGRYKFANVIGLRIYRT